jgi:hypothetical protein
VPGYLHDVPNGTFETSSGRGLDDRAGEVAEEVPDPVEEIGDGLVEAEGEEEDAGNNHGENGPRVDVRLVVRNVIVGVVAHGGDQVKGSREKGKAENGTYQTTEGVRAWEE